MGLGLGLGLLLLTDHEWFGFLSLINARCEAPKHSRETSSRFSFSPLGRLAALAMTRQDTKLVMAPMGQGALPLDQGHNRCPGQTMGRARA